MSSSELLEAYEAAVASTPEATACEPLLKALRTAAEGGSTPLSALHLKQVALGRAGACALSALLAKDSFLTYINLEGNDICDEGAVALSGPLTSHQSIFRLDLGFNTIGPKGLRALAGVVAVSPSLLCLDLSGNNLWSRLSLLAPASMSALAPLGNALAQETCRLQLLHLDQADIEPKGLTALVDGLLDNSVLVNLRLGENALDIRSAAVLAKLLRGNQTLTSLDLRDNKLGDDGAAALCEGLAENTGLRCLVLWNNGVGAAGVGAVAKAVSTSASLSILDLGGNAVGREGSEPLKTALVANKSLHTLGLANAQLGEEGGIAIAEGLEGNTRAHCVSSRCSHPAPSHSLTTLATPELARSPPIASPILWQAHAAARPEAQCARPRRADGPTPIDENEPGDLDESRTQEAPAPSRARRSQKPPPAPRQAMRDVAIDAVAGGENTEVEAQFLAEIRAACTVNAQRGGDGAAALPQLVGGLSAMEMMGRLGLNSDIDADAASTGAYTGAGVSATLGATASSGTQGGMPSSTTADLAPQPAAPPAEAPPAEAPPAESLPPDLAAARALAQAAAAAAEAAMIDPTVTPQPGVPSHLFEGGS